MVHQQIQSIGWQALQGNHPAMQLLTLGPATAVMGSLGHLSPHVAEIQQRRKNSCLLVIFSGVRNYNYNVLPVWYGRYLPLPKCCFPCSLLIIFFNVESKFIHQMANVNNKPHITTRSFACCSAGHKQKEQLKAFMRSYPICKVGSQSRGWKKASP